MFLCSVATSKHSFETVSIGKTLQSSLFRLDFFQKLFKNSLTNDEFKFRLILKQRASYSKNKLFPDFLKMKKGK